VTSIILKTCKVQGVLSTPALAVDGTLKFQGKVASSAEILELLRT